MAKPSLMIVDDEKEILSTLRRLLQRDFNLHIFNNPTEALSFYHQNLLPLVITDMRMPQMTGAELLEKIHLINPLAKSILLTGYSEFESSKKSVNEGKVNHIIEKPWKNQELKNVIQRLLNEYKADIKRKKVALHNKNRQQQLSKINESLSDELDKNQQVTAKLKNGISHFYNLISQAISLHTENTTDNYKRIANYAKFISNQLGCSKQQSYQTYIAGLLFDAGKLEIPQELLRKPSSEMSQHELGILKEQYISSAVFLEETDSLVKVSDIIRHIPDYHGSKSDKELKLNSAILSAVIKFDELTTSSIDGRFKAPEEALSEISNKSTSLYNIKTIQALKELVTLRPYGRDLELEFATPVECLSEGDVITQNISSDHNMCIVAANQQLTSDHIEKLKEIEAIHEEKLLVFVAATQQSSARN